MPMPTSGQWPPAQDEPAYQAYREWHAWYTGDPDLLGEVYRTRTDRSNRPRTRPSQYSGGIYGRLSRWWWGQPVTEDPTVHDLKFHVPAPADLATVSAELLFAEPPTLTAESDDTKVVERIAALADELSTLLLDAAEVCAAMSGVYLRPTVDTDLEPDRAFLTVVHADGALPRFRHGRLTEVTFWSTLEVDGTTHVRLLEHHEPGRIEYGLFRGDERQLGARVKLADHPDAKALVTSELQDGRGLDTKLGNRLDVVYIPNRGPQRRWRTVPHLKHLGRSDFDGVEQLFDKLDETWSSWMRDIHLGKGRVVVPSVYLQSQGPGQGAVFDADRAVYSTLEMLPRNDGMPTIQPVQFNIRVQEHADTADKLMGEILRAAGYDRQTLGEAGDVASVTATEVHARERRSFVTRDRKLRAWTVGVPQACELLLAVEQAHRLKAAIDPVRPVIEFGDSVSEDPETLARTAEMLRAAKAASTRTIVAMVHPDWTPEQVDAEITEIEKDRKAEQAMAMEADMFGGGGGSGEE